MKSKRVYAHYDFAMLLALLSTATRKVGAVYVVFLASTTAATYWSGIVWGAANGSFRLSSYEHGVSHSGRGCVKTSLLLKFAQRV